MHFVTLNKITERYFVEAICSMFFSPLVTYFFNNFSLHLHAEDYTQP